VGVVVAAVAAVAGTGLLLALAAGSPASQAAFATYGVGMVLLFSASAAYHLYSGPVSRLEWLHRLDHAAIFLLIAGSYTAIVAVIVDGLLGVAILVAIWTMAVVGIGLKLFVGVGPRRLAVLPYLAMGWAAVLVIHEIVVLLPVVALAWLVGGGLCYTVGGVVYALKRPDPWPGVFGFHEVWHLFVIGGAVCHYLLVLLHILPHTG